MKRPTSRPTMSTPRRGAVRPMVRPLAKATGTRRAVPKMTRKKY